MKMIIMIFVCLIPAIICSCASVYLAVLGVDGWGWFLFVAVLMSSSLSVKEFK